MAAGDIDEVASERHYKVNEDAYRAVDRLYRKLPLQHKNDPQLDFDADAYELCEFDGMCIEFKDKLVWGVCFHSTAVFEPAQLAELKALCLKNFEEAAAFAKVSCEYAGIRAYNEYSVTQELDLEVA